LAVGAALRLWNLSRQALLGDELHGVRLAVREPIPEILSAFHIPDCSLPLTALTRLALDHGVVVSEWMLRAPSLVAGWLLAAIGGGFLARRESPLAGAAFAGLAASSPLLVIYSRNARPYAVATTLAFLALVLFVAAWERRSPARFAAAALIGASAVWVLPTVLAVVGAPWAIGLIRSLGERHPAGAKFRRGLVAGFLLLLLGLVAVMLPPLKSLQRVMRLRAGAVQFASPSPSSVGRGLTLARPAPALAEGVRLVAGARSPMVAVTLLLAAAAGLGLAARRGDMWALVLAGTGIGHLLGLAVLRDYSMSYPLGVARLFLLALPVALAGLACLASRLASALRERTSAAVAAGFVAALLPIAAGPLRERLTVAPELLSAADRMQFTLEAPATLSALPEIYRREPLASARTIADALHSPENRFLRALIAEALGHRRRILLGLLRPELPLESVRLDAAVLMVPQAILDSEADVLLLRLHPGTEVLALDPRLGLRASDRERQRADLLDEAAATARSRLQASFGPPDAADEDRWVWDLRRLRRRKIAELG
jgi:hypothetical protein